MEEQKHDLMKQLNDFGYKFRTTQALKSPVESQEGGVTPRHHNRGNSSVKRSNGGGGGVTKHTSNILASHIPLVDPNKAQDLA